MENVCGESEKHGGERVCDRLTSECRDCGACVEHCPLLQRIGEQVCDIAARKPSFEEAYSCSLCRLCGEICPSGLCPGDMFAEKRLETVSRGAFPTEDYAYMMPDRHVTPASLYREKNGICYDDLALAGTADLAFMPGCSLITYSPLLVRRVVDLLRRAYPKLLLIDECCALPLDQLGFTERADSCRSGLANRLKAHEVNTVVTACPNCYRTLKNVTRRGELQGVRVRTLYSVVEELPENWPVGTGERTVTLHDSCPDRFDGVFAEEVRRALSRAGYSLIEMPRNRRRAPCCGSGGQVSHFAPDLSSDLINKRLIEAEQTGADILACCCMSCVLNFARKSSGQRVLHALNLLLDIQEDYSEVKAKAEGLFEGSEGEENWFCVMDDN